MWRAPHTQGNAGRRARGWMKVWKIRIGIGAPAKSQTSNGKYGRTLRNRAHFLIGKALIYERRQRL
jgi:hypothetical protein